MNPASSRSRPDLGVIFEEHFDYVWVALRRLGVRKADREDLVHDVFLKVHTHLANYDETGPIRLWLFGVRATASRPTITAWPVIAWRFSARRAKRRPGALPPTTASRPSNERELILEALQTIHVDWRTVLVMHDVDDIAMPQIAYSLDLPLNAAYSRLRLARDQLASALTRLRIARGVR